MAKIIPQKYFYDFYTVKNGNHENLFLKDSENIYSKIKEFIFFSYNGIKINDENQKLKKDKIKPISLSVYTRDVESNIIYRSALIKNKIHIETTTSDDTNSQFSLESNDKNDINREKKNIIISLNEENNKINKKINREESCDILTKNIPDSKKRNLNIIIDNDEKIANIINDKDNDFIVDKNKHNNFKFSQCHSEINKSVKYYNKEIKNIKNK